MFKNRHVLLSFFIFIISCGIYSFNPYTYFDVGNFGVEISSEEWLELLTWNASLPSIYIRDRDSDFGIGIQSLLYTSDFSLEESSFSVFDTHLYWSPILDDELNVLGPFVGFSINDIENMDFTLHVGLKFSHFSTILDKRFPSKFVYRPIDVEIAYSFFDNDFHIGYKLDMSFGFQMFLERLKLEFPDEVEVIEAIEAIEEIDEIDEIENLL
ncbi:MAG: hypothetical protein OCD02_14480 [Spirochaetaceae bacterium]